jgi:hypothetical protein
MEANPLAANSRVVKKPVFLECDYSRARAKHMRPEPALVQLVGQAHHAVPLEPDRIGSSNHLHDIGSRHAGGELTRNSAKRRSDAQPKRNKAADLPSH